MTRRSFICFSASTRLLAAAAPVIVPINLIVDGKANLRPGLVEYFRSHIWGEATRLLAKAGVVLDHTERPGEIERPAYRHPVFKGLLDGSLNVVITGKVPMHWDGGRALNGVTTIFRGYHLSVIALHWAHGNRLPFLALNTCVHELLHAFLHDIFENRPEGVMGQARELRVDAWATQLWIGVASDTLRRSTEGYVKRLRQEAIKRT